jgi:hypothetical protein
LEASGTDILSEFVFCSALLSLDPSESIFFPTFFAGAIGSVTTAGLEAMAAKEVTLLSLFFLIGSDDVEGLVKLGVHAAALADNVDWKVWKKVQFRNVVKMKTRMRTF